MKFTPEYRELLSTLGWCLRGTDEAGATFSKCMDYRYLLWRYGEKYGLHGDRVIAWIMLNPSTADENQLDPTVTRCLKYSQREKIYGTMMVCNLFALRSTDPKPMLTHDNPVGIGNDNDIYILQSGFQADTIVCAWGNHGAHQKRSRAVLRLLRPVADKLYYLKLNGTGEPVHPLYQRSDIKFSPFGEKALALSNPLS